MGTRNTSDYRTLASLSRINLLHELQQNGEKTVTELAEATGLHHNTAREHLHRLIEAGFVDFETIPAQAKGRPRLRYRAARGESSPAHQARLAAGEERTELLNRILPVTDISAERTPMDRQLDALDDHMDQCGFEAEITHDCTRMTMYDCPFGDLAKENPQVCEVHLGLVQSTLDGADGPLRATELHPFLGPTTCQVDLENPEE